MAYEDSQPNEPRLQPKWSAAIPLIQPSNPQRKRRISSDSALDVRAQPYATSTSGWYPPHYTSEDARIHNLNNFKRRRLLKPGSTNVSCNNNPEKNRRPTHEKTSGTSSYRPSPPPAPLSDTLNKTIHVQKPNPTKPPPLPHSDVHSSSTQPLKCDICKKAAKKKKKKKKKPPLLERATNLPSNCLKSVFNRKKYQHRLLSEVRQRLQDELDATIVCFQFTETQLIVKYRDKKKNPTTELAQSKNDENSGLSSGSNVKLGDSDQIIAHSVQLNKHKEESILILQQITNYPRPFRSGRILLDYSTPTREFNQVNIVYEGDGICSREYVTNESLSLSHPMPVSGIRKIVDHNTSGIGGSHKGDVNSVAVTTVNEESENLTQLLRANNDKPRRLFVSRALNRTYSISMHGYVQEIRKHSKPYTYYNTQLLYSPLPQVNEAVEDACLFEPPFDDLAIISRAHEDNPLTLFELRNNSQDRFTPIQRISTNKERQLRGVSAVTTLPTYGSSLSFVTAGYDHIIHLWSLPSRNLYNNPPISGVLNIRHSSLIQSLLVIENRLFSAGADGCVRIWDFEKGVTTRSIRTGSSACQLHPTSSPRCFLLEVGHCELQYELHDYRLSDHGRVPMRFGFPSNQGVQGRYARGVVDPRRTNTFISCNRDGKVRVWDLRNCGRCKQEIMCFPGQSAINAAFDNDKLIVASKDSKLMHFSTMLEALP